MKTKSLFILTSICLLLAINKQVAQQPVNQDSLKFKQLRIIEQGKTVNTGCGDFGTNQYQPNIAHDSKGNYLITWVDNRAGKNQIYAQLYNDKDEKVGTPILLEDKPAYYKGLPTLVYNKKTDEYLISWIENEQRVIIQRLKSDGTKIGSNLSIFEKSGIYKSNLEVFKNGNLIITWYMNGWDYKPYDLYFCVLNTSCKIIKEPALINKSINVYSARPTMRNTLATDTLGNAVVVWTSYYPPSPANVYLQVISQEGNLNGEPITVQDAHSTSTYNYYPQIASTYDGTFLITWTDQKFFWRKYYRVGIGFSETKILATTTYDWYLTTDKRNKFYLFSNINNVTSAITFSKEGDQISGPDILSKLIGSRLSFVFEGYGINYAGLSIYQNMFSSVYTIKNGSDHSIVRQKFSTEFDFFDEPTKISDDKCSAWQISPIVKYNRKGESIVLWTDTRNGRSDIYYQVYDVNNNPVGENTMLNDPSATYNNLSNVVVDTEDNFVFAYYIVGVNYYYYVQKISGKGVKIGTRNHFATSSMVFARYSIHTLENGEYFFITMPQSFPLREIQVTKLNSNFNTITKIDGFFKEKVKSSFDALSYSINSNNDILFTWIENLRMKNAVLKGIILSENGKIVKDTFVVSNLDRNSYYAKISNSFDKDYNMAITWNQMEYNNSTGNFYIHVWRSYPKFGTKFNSYPLPYNFQSSTIHKFSNKKLFFTSYHKYEVKGFYIDDNDSTLSAYSLHNFSESDLGLKYGYNSSNFGIDLFNNRLKLCYDSVKEPDKGFEVYQDLFALDEFDFTSIKNFNQTRSVSEVVLDVTNPVRSIGFIRYTIQQEHNVEIILYNILGEVVKVIESRKQKAGEYSIRFSTRGLSSGVYFIHYKGLNALTRKLLVVN